jgi:hypothetical protein
MTDEIDAMPAGPEMDALVEKRVMGRLRSHKWRTDGEYHNDPECYRCGQSRITPVSMKCIMPYSTSDAAALEVWKKISEPGLAENTNEYNTIQRTKDGYSVGYTYYEYFDVVNAPTFALAVCRAVLKAIKDTK